MKTVFRFAERLAGPLLRLSLGLVLLWIGAIHLATPIRTNLRKEVKEEGSI
jgi:hypothetical protein